MTKDSDADGNQEFEQLYLSGAPSVYFNGFQNGAGLSDVTSILQLNGRPVCTLSMSFTTAKTYSMLLSELIAGMEKDTGQEIMTTFTVEEAAKKAGRLKSQD